MEHVVESGKREAARIPAPSRTPDRPDVAEQSNPIAQLQQSAGNQAIQALFRSGAIRAKLAISSPDDPEENEANQVADKVMRSTGGFPAVSHCACGGSGESCEECQQNGTIHRSAAGGAPPHAHASKIVHEVLRSSGRTLDASTRAFFEPRFGRDFSNVRVHTGSEAANSARDINAHAYTSGSEIVFGAGQYSPDSLCGRRLLAHELAHVTRNSFTNFNGLSSEGFGDSSQSPGLTSNREGSIIRRQSADGASPNTGNDPLDAGAPSFNDDQPGGARYSRQSSCVARLGGCYQTRDAGAIEAEEIGRYNSECRKQSGYNGPDITPSAEECRQYSTGQLIDPVEIQRLQILNAEYLARLTAGKINVADALKIDTALRRAYLAMQRGGLTLPEVPPQVSPPPEISRTGPALPRGALLGLAGLGYVAASSGTSSVGAGGATGGMIAAQTGVSGVGGSAAGGTATAVVTTSAEGTALGAGAVVGGALVGLAVLTLFGLTIYWIVTLRDPQIDPTIPKDLANAAGEIEKTLETAVPPVVQPLTLPDIGPLPHQRRKAEQTCTNEVLDGLQDEKDRICNSIPGESCSPSKVSPKRLEKRPCTKIRERIQALRDCLRMRQQIQDLCFGGLPDDKHKGVFEQLNSGLGACLRLEAVNCAPGHPMENL